MAFDADSDVIEVEEPKNGLVYTLMERPVMSSEQKMLQILKKFGPNDAISEATDENNTVSSLTSPNASTKHRAYLHQVSAQLSED